jgi:proton glutamate symport protein
LVILAGTIHTFGLPAAGIAVLFGADALMDMGRTAVNVLGNCMATAVVARWEGVEFGNPVTGYSIPDSPAGKIGN